LRAKRIVATAPTANFSNTAAETVLYTGVVPAGTLALGTVLAIEGMVWVGSGVTGTFTARLRIGGVAGTIVAITSKAMTSNTTFIMRATLTIQGVGAGGNFTGPGSASYDLDGTTGFTRSLGAAINTTLAQSIVLTGQCSAANANNIFAGWSFIVENL
jgi:hypothetical protein